MKIESNAAQTSYHARTCNTPYPMQEKKIMEELGEGNSYAVVFDGTPYRCECFGIGIRFIGPDGKVRSGDRV